MVLARQRRGERLRLSHRLDRETSGVLLLARTAAADRLVKAQFEARERIVKRYLALAWGAPNWESYRCELPLEPDVDCGLRVKMRIAAEPAADSADGSPAAHSPAGDARDIARVPASVLAPHGAWTSDTRTSRVLSAATSFEVCGRRRHRQTGRGYTLLRCTLHTGRQHQIRVHLAALGCPVVGDKLYSVEPAAWLAFIEAGWSESLARQLILPRHALHAHALTFPHPRSGAATELSCPLPPDLQAFWDAQGPKPPWPE
jgi:23S rRNA pseudouridine1911/1915/1917 synthase